VPADHAGIHLNANHQFLNQAILQGSAANASKEIRWKEGQPVPLPNVEPLIWSRAVERVLIVVFSGISLILGWSLFKLGILQDQAATFASKSFSIRLQKVGPGIFFALFAVFGFTVAITRPLNLKEFDQQPIAAKDGQTTFEISSAASVGSTNEITIKTINTLEQLAISKAWPTLTSSEQAAVKEARANQDASKRQALMNMFGDDFLRYEKSKNQSGNPSALRQLTTQEKKLFFDIGQVADSMFIPGLK